VTGKLTIGLLQRKCSLDPAENLARTSDAIREAAKRGAQIVCLEELFRSQYFCREENHDNFALAESIPGASTEVLAKLAKELGIVIIASLFERRAAGLYHNTAAVLDADGSLLASTARCTFPTTLFITKSFTSRPATWGFLISTRGMAGIGVQVCWTSGTRKARASLACAARIFFFIPRPSAGTLGEGRIRRRAARCLAHGTTRPRHL